MQAVEDALVDAGYDDLVGAAERGTFHWQTVEKARKENGEDFRDERLVSNLPWGHWKTTTFVAALRFGEIAATVRAERTGGWGKATRSAPVCTENFSWVDSVMELPIVSDDGRADMLLACAVDRAVQVQGPT